MILFLFAYVFICIYLYLIDLFTLFVSIDMRKYLYFLMGIHAY